MTGAAPRVAQTHLPRKDALMLALYLRPLEDYMPIGDWQSPQLLFDLSEHEWAHGQRLLELLRPVIDATDEKRLALMLAEKLELQTEAGDTRMMLYRRPQ